MFLFLSVLLQAQAPSAIEKVDREKIRVAVSDSSSPLYYPVLLERWRLLDNGLSLEELRHLYYGYVFQPGYSAYADDGNQVLNQLWEQKKTEEALDTAMAVLHRSPVSLRANFNAVIAYYAADSTLPDFQYYMNRYKFLLSAILSSGDGNSCESAFKTIKVSDEYEIVYRHFGLPQVKSQALVYPCDKLSVTPNDKYTASTIFFDTSESFGNYTPREGRKKKRRGR